MPVALQSISACVGIFWLLTVNVQVKTRCFPSIDPSTTTTLQTVNREIPKHFKTFKIKFFRQTKRHPAWIDLIYS
jgi:hypothetical protein